MNEKSEVHMLSKFLVRNFPVSRIKHNGRFRRAIIFDDGEIYLYAEQKHMIALKYKLMNVLKETFLVNDTICLAVLDNFLQLDELG
jgi:hypothetical protein